MVQDILESARHYLTLGLAVLPLHFPIKRGGRRVCSCGARGCGQAAKHPFGRLVPRGLRNASKAPAEVEGWFAERRLNLGIATGAVSGIFVVDVDPRHEGDETLAALEVEFEPLPPTWRFQTGGNGEHILFRHPGAGIANNAGKLDPGLDIRGDGGYIVAPPSLHISGQPYAISADHHPDDVPLANAPAWLLERVTETKRATGQARQVIS